MDDLSGLLRPLVLTVGLDRALDESCRQLFRILDVDGADGVLRQIHEREIPVLMLGPRLAPVEGQGILARCISECPVNSTAIIVLCAGPDRAVFQKFLDENRIFYLSRGPVTDDQLRSLVVSAATRLRTKVKPEGESLASGIVNIDLMLDFLARLPVQPDLSSASGLLIQTVRDLIHADSARCLIYDPDSEVLTPADAVGGKERAGSASAGLAGFVVRTHERVHLDRAGADPRYDCDTDNPGGSEDARFMAAPIFGDRKSVAGVITAVRDGRAASFSANDGRLLGLLAECAAPTFSQILLQNRLQALLPRQTGTTSRMQPFRVEAAENHIKSYDEQSAMFQTLPKWLKRAQWALVGLVLVSLLGGLFGKVNEYTRGPAAIRARDKIEVTAEAPGRVCSVEVSVGDRVKAGDTLVRLDGAINPTTPGGYRNRVPAHENGIVGEIHVHSGQFVNPGDQVMTIVSEQAPYDLVAFLPGSYARQLRPGMPLRVRFHGCPRSPEVMPIDSVGPEFPTLREAARYAGVEDFKGSEVGGPAVMVRAFLPSAKFAGEAGSNTCCDGMTGEADVRVRSEPIIISVLPSLKKIFGMAK